MKYNFFYNIIRKKIIKRPIKKRKLFKFKWFKRFKNFDKKLLLMLNYYPLTFGLNRKIKKNLLYKKKIRKYRVYNYKRRFRPEVNASINNNKFFFGPLNKIRRKNLTLAPDVNITIKKDNFNAQKKYVLLQLKKKKKTYFK